MPDDDNFRGLLSDYVAPISDDGFSDMMMAQIDAKDAKVALWRRLALYGAGFAGGIIAALQLPKLVSLMPEIGVDVPSLPMGEFSTSALAINPVLMMVAALIGLVLWAALDQRAAELF